MQEVSRVQERARVDLEGVRLRPEHVHLRQSGKDRRRPILRNNEPRQNVRQLLRLQDVALVGGGHAEGVLAVDKAHGRGDQVSCALTQEQRQAEVRRHLLPQHVGQRHAVRLHPRRVQEAAHPVLRAAGPHLRGRVEFLPAQRGHVLVRPAVQALLAQAVLRREVKHHNYHSLK